LQDYERGPYERVIWVKNAFYGGGAVVDLTSKTNKTRMRDDDAMI